MRIKNSSTFRNYLTSYIIAFIIPIIALSFLIHNKYTKLLEDEISENNLSHLRIICNVVDNEINRLNSISKQIILNRRLKPFHFEDSPEKSLIVNEELKNLLIPNSFLDNIFVYYNNENYLYSTNSSFSLDYFINHIYKYENWNYESFYKTINSCEIPCIIPATNVYSLGDQKNRYVTMLYPLRHSNLKHYGTVIYLINESTFSRLMRKNSKDFVSSTLIIDENNNIIAKSENTATFQEKELELLMRNNLNFRGKEMNLNEKRFYISMVKSNSNKWKYLMITDYDTIMKKATKLKYLFLCILFILFIVGSILIWLLMSYNYTPIKKLLLFSEKIVGLNNQADNEINSIYKSIEYLSNKNKQLFDKIQLSKNFSKDYILYQLINGHYSNTEELNQNGTSLGIEFYNPFYFVVIVKIKNNTKNSLENIVQTYIETFSNNYETYSLKLLGLDQIIFIHSIDKINQDDISSNLIDFQHKLKYNSSAITNITVGNVYDNLQNISMSYMEALTSFKYEFSSFKHNILFFNDIVLSSSENKAYPVKLFAELELSLESTNTRKINYSLECIQAFMRDNGHALISKIVHFQLVNLVIISIQNSGKSFEYFSLPYTNIFTLAELETLDELFPIIKHIFNEICIIKENQNPTLQSDLLIEQIYQYIEHNYLDSQFSVQEMAKHFKMPLSTLSSQFKEVTGVTVLNHITLKRMEKTKALLIETNLPISKIVTLVGYTNASSFIRRFKQMEGVTPGEFRKSLQ